MLKRIRAHFAAREDYRVAPHLDDDWTPDPLDYTIGAVMLFTLAASIGLFVWDLI